MYLVFIDESTDLTLGTYTESYVPQVGMTIEISNVNYAPDIWDVEDEIIVTEVTDVKIEYTAIYPVTGKVADVDKKGTAWIKVKVIDRE